ncbi:uncharacterized protein [Ptychodera flava]|uniref:uncharacterized protein n=1 Tax=Ptychodera flava TaxID=63121 RepID=UPI003969EF36
MQPVVVQAVPGQQQQQPQQPQRTRREIIQDRYAAKVAAGFGIVIIISGGLVLIFGVATIVLQCQLHQVGSPFFCGVLFVVTGCVCLMSSYKRTQGYIVASMVFCIIAATLAIFWLMIIESVAVALEESYYYYDYNNYDCYDPNSYQYDPNCDSIISRRRAIGGVLIGLSLLVAILATIFAPFTCYAVCCVTPRPTPVMYYVASQPGSAPVPAGQVLMVPAGSQIPQGVAPPSGQVVQAVPYYSPPQPAYPGQAYPQQQQQYPKQVHVTPAVPQSQATAPQPPAQGDLYTSASPPPSYYSSLNVQAEASGRSEQQPEQTKSPLV